MPGPGTAIGTNAMAVAANATAGDAFCMDMATSGVAVGKVEVCHRKGVEVPHGWGLDKNGYAHAHINININIHTRRKNALAAVSIFSFVVLFFVIFQFFVFFWGGGALPYVSHNPEERADVRIYDIGSRCSTLRESTTVPAKMLPTAGGALLPLGGVEETAGYKGYALGMMVEMLCGVLPNAATGPDVQPWKPGRPRAIDYGHCA